jgi:hypothetical protein
VLKTGNEGEKVEETEGKQKKGAEMVKSSVK